jgi:hypothetical protein
MSMQAILKSGFKPAGTFNSVFKDRAEDAVGLLGAARASDEVMKFTAVDARGQNAAGAIMNSAADDKSDTMHVKKLVGSRKVLVMQGNIYTDMLNYKSMVSEDLT